MTKQQFDTLMQMHRDTLSEVQATRKALEKHVEDDNKVHRVVDRHTTYWWGLGSAVGAAFAAGLAWLEWR